MINKDLAHNMRISTIKNSVVYLGACQRKWRAGSSPAPHLRKQPLSRHLKTPQVNYLIFIKGVRRYLEAKP